MEEIGMPHVSEQEGEVFLEAHRAEFVTFKNKIMAKYAGRN